MNFASLLSSRASVFLLFAALLCLAHAETFYVDVILPETGGTPTENTMYSNARKAAELAAADITTAWAAAGDSLVVSHQDTENNGATTLRYALASAQDNTRIAVIGAGSETLTVSTAQLLHGFNMPLISPFTTEPSDAGLQNFYSAAADHTYQAKLLKVMLDRFNWTKVGILHTPEEDSIALRNAILALPGISVTEVIETAYTTQDYLPASQPLINASTNIYIIIIPDPTILRTFITTAGVSGGFFVGPKAFFYLNANETVARAAVPQGGLIFSQTEGTPANVTSWKAKAADLVTPGAATTYDAVWAIAHSIDRLKAASAPVTRDNIVTELHNTNEHSFSGPLSFDAAGYRSVQTYNITNVATVVAATGLRVVRPAFTWDGALRVASPVVWPGNAVNRTSGRTTIYPVGYISSMYDTKEQMIAADNVLPLTVTAQRSLSRWAVATVNSLILAPYDVQISSPPLNDNGTINGAVRVSTSIASSTYLAMIATWDTTNTRIIQGVLSAYNVPQIAYYATDPAFSNKNTYPTLVRVSPSDTAQIQAMFEMINHFGWTQVSAIASTSSYGQQLEAAWSERLSSYSGTITRGRGGNILEDGTGLEQVLKTMAEANVNIICLLVEPRLYSKIHLAMKELEYKPRAVIVTDKFFRPQLWDYKLNGTGLALSDFAGWVGVSPAAGDYAGPGIFGDVSDLIRFNTTLTAYPGLLDALNNAPEYVAYILDCFYVVADGIAKALDAGEDPKFGSVLMKYIAKVDVLGSTGPLAFDRNLDRTFNPYVARYVRNNGSFANFASWDETARFAQATPVVWPSGTTDVPVAVEPRTIKWLFWSSPAAIVLAAFAGFGLLLTTSMTFLVIIWRDSPVIVSSTYPFLLLILFGAGLGFGSMFTWIGEPRTWICALRIWLPPMAFVLMLSPLLAKTWRLHRIFTLASLKTTPIPLWKLVIMVVCICLIQVGICVAWISAGTIQPTIMNDKQDFTNSYKICALTQPSRIASYVTYGYLGFLLLVGAYYAFRVRNLPKDFNESRWIGFSIYNTLLFSVIIVILGYALTDFRVTVLILICVCTLAITFGVVGLMMAPKLWDLIMNPNRRSGSGSGGLTYSGNTSSPNGSKYLGSFRSEPGSNSNLYNTDNGNGNSSPRNTSERGDRGSNGGRRHDFSRKRGEPSAHSKDSKDRDSNNSEMKPLKRPASANPSKEKSNTSTES